MTAANETQSGPAFSLDAFHRGGFFAVQPQKTGHRAGSDALLLAASLPAGSKGELADLGSGAGVAAMAALVMNPALQAALVEIDPLMAQCARDSLALQQNASISSRARVIEADITLSGKRREAVGLANASFDHVICNPPYHALHERASPDARRALAHMATEGGIDAWMRTAAAILRPGGVLHLVWRPQQFAELIHACSRRFGGLQVLPLHPHSSAPAGRIIVRATKGSKAPLMLLPGIALHDGQNLPTPLADLAINGMERLPFVDVLLRRGATD